MPEILHTLPIRGPRREVYGAVTEQEGLRGWWTRFTSAEPKIGYINEFRFGGEFKFDGVVDSDPEGFVVAVDFDVVVRL